MTVRELLSRFLGSYEVAFIRHGKTTKTLETRKNALSHYPQFANLEVLEMWLDNGTLYIDVALGVKK